jgi:hypothetical protein
MKAKLTQELLELRRLSGIEPGVIAKHFEERQLIGY